jgi:vanillate O-demethylase ferredoxin subunit
MLARLDARFRLLYAGRRREAMPFVDELHARLGDRLALRISEEGTRLDLAAEIASLHPQGELYLCGPMRLVDSARRAFQASGRPSENLRFETFGSSGKHAPEAFVVKVVDRGVELTVPENRTMLDVLRDAGVEMMFDCLRGECGLCAVDVVAVDGEIDHRDVFLSEAQKSEQKKICACVSRAVRGSITVDTGFRPGPRRGPVDGN